MRINADFRSTLTNPFSLKYDYKNFDFFLTKQLNGFRF